MQRSKKTVKMSQTLALGMFFVALAGLVVTVLIIGTTVHRVVYENARENAFHNRQTYAHRINSWLSNAEGIVVNLSETLPLADRGIFQDVVSHYLSLHDFAEAVWIAFEDGTYYDGGLAPRGEGLAFTERDWWIWAKEESGSVVFTSPNMSATTGAVIITVARHFNDFHGQEGVIAMNIELEQLEVHLRTLYDYTGDYLLVLGAYGELIIHPDRNYMPAEDGTLRFAADISRYAAMYERVLAGEEIFRSNEIFDDDLYVMQFFLPAAGWTMISAMPAHVTLNPVWQATAASVVSIAVVLAAVSLFMFMFFSRRFLRPIEILTDGVSEITAGNLDVKITNTMRNDEIGTLSKAIRTTLRKIHTAQELDRDRIQRILDSAPMSVTCYDTSLTMFDCNEEAVRIFGYENKAALLEAFRERFLECFPEIQHCGTPSKEKAAHCFDTAIEKGVYQLEFDHIDAKGNFMPADITMVRVDYADTFMIVVYLRDMREVHEVENERRRKEVAEESNRAKSRFLARMSHEIRTPITAVLGISEIELQNPGLPPRLEESFAKINTSANMLLGIVNDVLDLSKIESGKMELINEEYEVASMINDVTQLYPAHLKSKDISFRLSIDENLPARLCGDSLRIKQIMNNLISNAFKYTESGMVELSWRAEATTLIISLRDTGYGMTDEQLDLIRGEYIRVHEIENRAITGTGLGMPIVLSLLRLMGAEMEMESKPNIGTKVLLRIPQKLGASSEKIGKALAEQLQEFKGDARAAGKKFSFEPEPMPYGNALVVDDVSENIYVIKGLLAFYDLKVETCTSGHAAIDKIKSGKTYDVIFMDHMMPVMNGMEALKKIRALGYTKPIIALTANALIGVAEEFIKGGFDGFISKPIQTKHLNTILHRFVRDKYPPDVVEAALKSHKESKTAIDDFQYNTELIAKLKSLFAQKHKNSFENLTTAITADDIGGARVLAHTIKGVASLIQEQKLADVAYAVESMLAAGDKPSSEKLSALETELSRVLASIKAVPGQNSYVTDLLDKLEPMLESQSIDCQDFLEELRAIPEALILCKQIENFDYKEAIKNLEILRAALE